MSSHSTVKQAITVLFIGLLVISSTPVGFAAAANNPSNLSDTNPDASDISLSSIDETSDSNVSTSSTGDSDETSDSNISTSTTEDSEATETSPSRIRSIGAPIVSSTSLGGLQELNVSIDRTSTIYNTSMRGNGTIMTTINVTGYISPDQYPRKFPVVLSVKGGDGTEFVNREINLRPEGVPSDFSDVTDGKRDYKQSINITLEFAQNSTTSHDIIVNATSKRGGETDSDVGTFFVAGKSETQTASATQVVLEEFVDEPEAEVTFVDNYRSTESRNENDYGYLETPRVPFSNSETPQGEVINFVGMRAPGSPGALFDTNGSGTFNIGTITRGVPQSVSQTLVVEYGNIEEAINIQIVNSEGEVISPSASSRYSLVVNPTTRLGGPSKFCRKIDGNNVCFFPLSKSERDVVSLNKELYVHYTSPEGNAQESQIYCQSVISGALSDNEDVCGLEVGRGDDDGDDDNDTDPPQCPAVGIECPPPGNNTTDDPTPIIGDPWPQPTGPYPRDGITGHNASIPLDEGNWSNPYDNLTRGNNVDANVTVGNYGTKPINARLEIYPTDKTLYRIVENAYSSLTWQTHTDHTKPPRTCADYEAYGFQNENRTYIIKPYPDRAVYMEVECNFGSDYTDNVAWTKITKTQMEKELNGTWSGDTSIEFNDTIDSTSIVAYDDSRLSRHDFSVRYSFDVPFEYTKYYLDGVRVQSATWMERFNSLSDTYRFGSELGSNSSSGDVVFGANTREPVSAADALGVGTSASLGRSNISGKIANGDVRDAGGTRDTFEIRMSEQGTGAEGWVIPRGSIWFRSDVSDNLDSQPPLSISTQNKSMSTNNVDSVRVAVTFDRVYGTATDITLIKETSSGTISQTKTVYSDDIRGGHFASVKFTDSGFTAGNGGDFRVEMTQPDSSQPTPSVNSIHVVGINGSGGTLSGAERFRLPANLSLDNDTAHHYFQDLETTQVADGQLIYKSIVCLSDRYCLSSSADDSAYLVVNMVQENTTENETPPPEEEIPPNASAGGPYFPEYEVDSIYRKLLDDYERRYVVNEPEGSGWINRGNTTESTDSVQRTTVTLRNKQLATVSPEDMVDEAKSKLGPPPAGHSWTLESINVNPVDTRTVKATSRSSYADDPVWQRSDRPVREAKINDTVSRFFESSSTTVPVIAESGEGRIEVTKTKIVRGGNQWYLQFPIQDRRETSVTDTVYQHEDPNLCKNCLRAETLSEAKMRFANTTQHILQAKTSYRKAEDDAIIDTVSYPSDSETFFSPVNPGADAYHIEKTSPDNYELWFELDYERRPIYVWQAETKGISFKYTRNRKLPVYEYTRTLYEIDYSFSAETGSQNIKEWERRERAVVYDYSQKDLLWLDGSGSHDNPESHNLQRIKWTIAGNQYPGESSWYNWNPSIRGVEPGDRTCSKLYGEGSYNIVENRESFGQGTYVEQFCENESRTNPDRKYLRAGFIIDEGTEPPEAQITVMGQEGLTDTARALIRPADERRTTPVPSIYGHPEMNVTFTRDRADYRYGFGLFKIRLTPEFGSEFNSEWELAVSPSDKISDTSVCPTGYDSSTVTRTEEEGRTGRLDVESVNCVRPNPSSGGPDSFTLESTRVQLRDLDYGTGGPASMENKGIVTDRTYPVPAGAARTCEALGYQRKPGSTDIVCRSSTSGATFTLADYDSVDDEFIYRDVSGTFVSTCPRGYEEKETSNIVGNVTAYSNTTCVQKSETSYELKSRQIRYEFEQVPSDVPMVCPPGYGDEVVDVRGGVFGERIDCVKTGSHSGPESFIRVNSDGYRQPIPAGAFRRCPDGWNSSISIGNNTGIREDQWACYKPGSDDSRSEALNGSSGETVNPSKVFVIATIDESRWRINDVAGETAGYAPNSEKIVWSGDSLPARGEVVTVTINPRKNQAITRGENEFRFILRNNNEARATIEINTTNMYFCEARQSAIVPKRGRGPYECEYFDSDGDNPDEAFPTVDDSLFWDDWVGAAVLDVGRICRIGETGECTRDRFLYTAQFNDACPYDPTYPTKPEGGYGVIGFSTNETVRSWYGNTEDNQPCQEAGVGAEDVNFEYENPSETITWEMSDWNDEYNNYSQAIRYRTYDTLNPKLHSPYLSGTDEEGPYGPLRIGPTLNKELMADSLVSYYPFERDRADFYSESGGRDYSSEPPVDIYKVYDAYTEDGAQNGRFWFRNPCFGVPSSHHDEQLLNQRAYTYTADPHFVVDCPSIFDGTEQPVDKDRDHFLIPEVNQNNDEDILLSEFDGDKGLLPKLSSTRGQGGLFGTGAYHATPSNWIELSGPVDSENSYNRNPSSEYHPGTDLASQINDGDGSYTVQFWYKPDQNSLTGVRGQGTGRTTPAEYMAGGLFGVTSPSQPNVYPNTISLFQMETPVGEGNNIGNVNWVENDGTVDSVGWPILCRSPWQKVTDAGGMGCQSPMGFNHGDGRPSTPLPLFSHYPTREPTQTTQWHRVTLVHIGPDDDSFNASRFEGYEHSDGEALILYIDGQRRDMFTEEDSSREWRLSAGGCENILSDCRSPHTPLNQGEIPPDAAIALGATWAIEPGDALEVRENSPCYERSDCNTEFRTQGLFKGKFDEVKIYSDPESFEQDSPLSNRRVRNMQGARQGYVVTEPKHFSAPLNNSTTERYRIRVDGNIPDETNVRIYPVMCRPTGCSLDSEDTEYAGPLTNSTFTIENNDEVGKWHERIVHYNGPASRHVRLMVFLTTNDPEVTPVVRNISIQRMEVSNFNTCGDLLKSAPGIYSHSGTYNVSLGQDGPKTVECDMETLDGGWTKFLWTQRDDSGDWGSMTPAFRPLLHGGKYNNCEVDQQVCAPSIQPAADDAPQVIDNDGDLEILVKATTRGGEERKAVFDLNTSGGSEGALYESLSERLTDGLVNGTATDYEDPVVDGTYGDRDCLNAYYYSDTYSPFGSNSACRNSTEIGGSTIYLGDTRSEDGRPVTKGFHIFREDGVIKAECLGIGKRNLQSCEVYFRDGDIGFSKVLNNSSDASTEEPSEGPTARIDGPSNVPIDENGTFDGSSSFDDGGAIESWSWSVDGRSIGWAEDDQEMSYNFSEGTHTVTLVVTDDDGFTDRKSVIVQVNENFEPHATISDLPTSTLYGSTVTLDGSESRDPDGDISSYEWFVNGSSVGTGATYDHTFTQNGTLTVRLEVTDDDGLTSNVTETIEVRPSSRPVGEVILAEIEADSCREDGRSVCSGPNWERVEFDNEYDNPVVIARPMSNEDSSQPAVARIKNVASDGVSVQVEEFDSNSSDHGSEFVTIIVMEEGQYELSDGRKVNVGTTPIRGSEPSEMTTRVTFERELSSPVVFSTPQTKRDDDTVVTRNYNVDSSGFNIALQEEEYLHRINDGHRKELVGYIAINSGEGHTAGVPYMVGRVRGITDATSVINTGGSYDHYLGAFALQTRNDNDPAVLRVEASPTPNTFPTYIDEGTTYDVETSHSAEEVGFWVFGHDTTINGTE